MASDERSYGSESNSLTFKIIIHMSLSYIDSKNSDLSKALKCLALCPGGLRKRDLEKIVKDWGHWVELLKDRSLVKEKFVGVDKDAASPQTRK
jgi:hypothetical protein